MIKLNSTYTPSCACLNGFLFVPVAKNSRNFLCFDFKKPKISQIVIVIVMTAGYKTQTRYKMKTRNYELSIKHGLRIKRGLRTVYIKAALER